MSLNTDLVDRIPILRRRQNSHVSGKEVVQNVLESRLQLTAALGKQNVRLREPERQIRLDELGVPSGQIRGELLAQVLIEGVTGLTVRNGYRLYPAGVRLDPYHVAHCDQQKHDHEPGHQIAQG